MPKVVSERLLKIPLEEWVRAGLGIVETLAKQGEFHNRIVFNGDRVELSLQKFEWSEEEKAQIAAEKAAEEAKARKAAEPVPEPEPDEEPEAEESESKSKPATGAEALARVKAIPKWKKKGK